MCHTKCSLSNKATGIVLSRRDIGCFRWSESVKYIHYPIKLFVDQHFFSSNGCDPSLICRNCDRIIAIVSALQGVCVVIQVFKHNTFNIERYHKIVVLHVHSFAM